MGFDDIRTALRRGFSVGTLNEITRLGHDLLTADTSLRHPSAAYVIAATAQKLAWLLDHHAQDDAVAIIEPHIKPKLNAVLDVADSDTDRLVRALDDLARAYGEASSLLKQCSRGRRVTRRPREGVTTPSAAPHDARRRHQSGRGGGVPRGTARPTSRRSSATVDWSDSIGGYVGFPASGRLLRQPASADRRHGSHPLAVNTDNPGS